MPKNADVITKRFVSQNHIFADIVNYYIFDGEQKINENDLTALNSVETAFIKNRIGKMTGMERTRDVLKSVVIRESKDVIYVLVGVENQTDIHYAMPVRNLLYDAINYSEQVSKRSNEIRGRDKESKTSGDEKKTRYSNGEFLSGFGKDDKLVPVVTITFYWGDLPWDAPRKLSDMFKPDTLAYNKYVNDYDLNLIIPEEINDIEKFRTDLNLVIKAMAARNDDEAFEKLIGKDEYKAVEPMTADVICELTSLKRPKIAGGKINMCKAVEEIKRKAMERGIERGIEKGIERGIEKGIETGIDKVIVSMLSNNISPEEIARMTGMSLERICNIEKMKLKK